MVCLPPSFQSDMYQLFSQLGELSARVPGYNFLPIYYLKFDVSNTVFLFAQRVSFASFGITARQLGRSV